MLLQRAAYPDDYSRLRAQQALSEARLALRRGDRLEARRLAGQAARLAPHQEDPWLILAATSSQPRTSIQYLLRALETNPSSQRARAGIKWAIKRLRLLSVSIPQTAGTNSATTLPLSPIPQTLGIPRPSHPPPISRLPIPPPRAVTHRSFFKALLLLLMAALTISLVAVALAPWVPGLASSLGAAQQTALAWWISPTPTDTATPTNTPSPTATHTLTPTATFTVTPTNTPTPTSTSTLSPTPSPSPSLTPSPTKTPKPRPTRIPKRAKPQVFAAPGPRPSQVGPNERWIDVDLSSQRTFAMVGDQIVNQFIVSTGAWPTVTITGVFRIYVKYRTANMSGPDYFLPNVPYVMYFYKGYGLHGTYWHNNFGTPMSHGCINLRPADAAWLFNWASVGTVVSIHQ